MEANLRVVVGVLTARHWEESLVVGVMAEAKATVREDMEEDMEDTVNSLCMEQLPKSHTRDVTPCLRVVEVYSVVCLLQMPLTTLEMIVEKRQLTNKVIKTEMTEIGEGEGMISEISNAFGSGFEFTFWP